MINLTFLHLALQTSKREHYRIGVNGRNDLGRNWKDYHTAGTHIPSVHEKRSLMHAETGI